ncbi:MAG: Acyl-CoA dehydrogenase C-terminal domain-containing protein [Bacteroidales bacterium]
MAGFIIMGYLLLMDTNRDHKYWKTLEVYLKFARSQNEQRAEFIRYSNVNDLGKFKVE